MNGTIATDVTGTEDEFHITRQVNGGVSWPQVAAFQLGTYNNSGACCGPQTRLDINLKAAGNGTLTGDTNVMTLLSNGNVGIGTTSPAQKLEIYGQDAAPATSGTIQNGNARFGGQQWKCSGYWRIFYESKRSMVASNRSWKSDD